MHSKRPQVSQLGGQMSGALILIDAQRAGLGPGTLGVATTRGHAHLPRTWVAVEAADWRWSDCGSRTGLHRGWQLPVVRLKGHVA